jgi:NADH-quinone oxidoreductase subunit N
LAFGIALLYGATGTFHLDLMADVLSRQLAVGGSNSFSTLGLGFLVGGLIIPLGISLLSGWPVKTRQTMRKSEELYDILLPGATITALGRLTSIWPSHLEIVLAILIVCLIGIGYIAALRSRAIETTLHGIAIAQTGLVLIVLQNSVSAPVWGLMLYLFISSSASLTGLWALVAQAHSDMEQNGTKRSLSLGHVIGLGQRRPWIAAAATLCLLNLAGAPPLAGSIGQWHLYDSVIENEFQWQVWFMIVNMVGIWLLTARWMTAIWKNPTQQQESGNANPEIVILALLTGAGILLMGLYADTVLNWLIQLATGTN